jgi:hypothetical protein
MDSTERLTLSLPETADLLGISRWAVQRAAHDGSLLPSVRVVRRTLLPAWWPGSTANRTRRTGSRPAPATRRARRWPSWRPRQPARQLTSGGRPHPGVVHSWSAARRELPGASAG